MKCAKNVDLGMVIKSLANKHVKHHADFDIPLDIKTLKMYVTDKDKSDRFLWYQQRACGSWLVNVEESFKRGGGAHIQWLNEANNGNTAKVKAYIIIPSEVSNGKVMGDIYTIDYGATVKAVEQNSYLSVHLDEPVSGHVAAYISGLRNQMKTAKEITVEAFVGGVDSLSA